MDQASSAGDLPQQNGGPQPGFLPQPSALTFGPPADLAMGWDGTVWAVDDQGAPHVFDPIAGAWQAHGTGIDAVAWVPGPVRAGASTPTATPTTPTTAKPAPAAGGTRRPAATATGTAHPAATATPTPAPRAGKPGGLYVFRGPEVWLYDMPSTQQTRGKVKASPPTPIASVWPQLPPSFQAGVDGAADVGGVLYFFKAGRYVAADGGDAVASLTELRGWPTTGAFVDGVVDVVGSGYGDSQVVFIRGTEVLIVDFAQHAVIWGPVDLGAGFGGAVLDRLRGGGVDALLYDGTVSAATTPVRAFTGPSVVAYSGSRATAATSEAYLPRAYSGWPTLWNPQLLQAPAGRVGALWAVATPGTGSLLTHDGQSWSPSGLPGGDGAASVAVGADGAIFAAGGSTLYGLDASGAVPQWQTLATAPAPLAQVAVGDAAHVWVRDGDGAVSRYGGNASAGGAFTPANLGTTAAHLAANADGSLWHCDGSGATAHRFISEGTAPPEALSVAADAGAVQKVASTGYGRGWVLAGQGDSPQLYAYESPYLFKTGPSYILNGPGVLATGAGAVYLSAVTDPGQPTVVGHLVALDALTGQERWRRDVPATTFTFPVYDPALEMVYIAGTDGYVSALDARTGTTTWEYQTGSVVDAPPALDGGRLYFGARDGLVRCLDVAQALADWTASKAEPTPVWETRWPPYAGMVARMTAPLATGGKLYLGAWTPVPETGQSYQLALCQVDAATGTVDWAVQVTDQTPADIDPSFLPLFPPVLGQAQFETGLGPAVIANAYAHLVAVRTDDATGPVGETWVFSPSPPGPGEHNVFLGGLTLRGNRLFTGDYTGRLLIIDPTTWSVLSQTPTGGDAVFTTPVVSGAVGAETVFYAPYGAVSAEVRILDVASGSITVLPTGQTAVAATSGVGADGILYVAGAKVQVSTGLGQVFALRMDAAAAAAHDVIAESQLLQDYDEPAGGKLTAVARYQTHLTVVDDAGAPRPLTALRVWADAPVTVQVDGRPFPIGPQTAAAVQTAADGSLSIVSDAGGLAATPLRVWASFMDPAERIVVYPDAEFHLRLAAAAAQPGGDDPTSVNLSTAKSYAGTALFSNQAQAQQLAQVVRQLAGAAGLGGGGGSVSAATAGTGVAGAPVRPATLLAPSGRRHAPAFAQTGTAGRYVPYADLPGMAYFAADTPAARALAPGAALGLLVGADGTLSVSPVAAAAAAADALQGQAPAAVGGLFSFWDALWDDLKKGLAHLERVVVTVARDVGLAIQYVKEGVTYVFRAVVRGLEDVAHAVAAFFVALGKDIAEVVQALSIAFDPARVLAAQAAIERWVNDGLDSYVSNLNTYVKQPLDAFFESEEQKIADFFTSIRNALGPQLQEPVIQLLSAPSGAADASPIAGTAGAGTTVHTLFSVRPKGGTHKVSHAVACTWALRKLTHHLTEVGPPPTGTAGAPGDTPPPAPLQAFADGFVQRLTSDPVLAPAIAKTKADFKSSLGNIHSLDDFLERLTVADLLDVLEDLLVGGLAVLNALFDGLIAVLADLVEWVKYLLNEPIQVPVLTALYREMTGGQQLTLLSVVSLVCAVPLILILRLVDGAWPDFSDETARAGEPWGLGLTTAAKAFGIVNGLCWLVNGLVRSVIDYYTGATEGIGAKLNQVLGKFLLLWNIVRNIFAFPNVSGTATHLEWEAWGIGLLGTIEGILFYFGKGWSMLAGPGLAVLGSILVAIQSAAAIAVFSLNWAAATTKDTPITRTKFAGQILTMAPGVPNPLKFLGEATEGWAPVIVTALDVLGGLGAAACIWTVLGENWDK